MDSNQHPWQNGPTEIIDHAITHLYGSADFDQRMAFLLLDIGVETTLRTYLILPEEVTKAQSSFSDRRKSAEGSFHELLQGVGKAARNRLAGINIQHIHFYHNLRNKLYHEGNGITIPTEKAHAYAEIAVNLLKTLLDVDLSNKLQKLETSGNPTEPDGKYVQLNKIIDSAIIECRTDFILAVERFEPKLVLPTFRTQFQSIANEFYMEFWSYDDADEYFEENLAKQIELTKKWGALIKKSIRNPVARKRLFQKVVYNHRVGVDIKIDAASTYFLETKKPDIHDLYLHILHILDEQTKEWDEILARMDDGTPLFSLFWFVTEDEKGDPEPFYKEKVSVQLVRKPV